jgi:hypothetical protein
MLGAPDRQRDDGGSTHRCSWDCGCEAINARGLCFEDGWALETCRLHPALTAGNGPNPGS